MIKRLKNVVYCLFVLAFVYACSTEKNTLLSRSYHGLNAHYNGYYNVNELINQSLSTYRSSLEEDYYSILPIDVVPSKEDIIGMYPAIDTAIAKCTKVIQDHSMPSNDRPARKKDEHNKWIDENWTTVGQAFYYRRDYEGAIKNFKFIKKFFKNDPSLYVGDLWMAKTNIAQGKYTEAKFSLDKLDKAIAEEESRGENAKKTKIKKNESNKIASFPKKIKFDLEKTKADLALKREDNQDAIKFLESSLNFTKKSKKKTRVHFILAQLYEEAGDDQLASEHYAKVLKGDAPFQMSFNARLKKAFLGESEKKKVDLNKMLKDAKNAEFKDQIYYALAGIEFKEGEESKGIEYLHQSAFFSTKNTRQKGMAYETLADMSFEKRNYVSAQKYYDSCATVIKDDYPNAEGIRNKASNLADLVVAVETSKYEDSVQMIAGLNEDNRKDFLKGLIKQINTDLFSKKVYSESFNVYSEQGLLISDVQDYGDDIYSTFYEYNSNKEIVSTVRSSKNKGVVRKWKKTNINNNDKAILKKTGSIFSSIYIDENDVRYLHSYISEIDINGNIIKKISLTNGVIDFVDIKVIAYYD